MSEHLTSDPVATPKTDAAAFLARQSNASPPTFVVSADFAREQERTIIELIETLRLAQVWLTGWASAEDELTVINRAIQKASSYERTAVE